MFFSGLFINLNLSFIHKWPRLNVSLTTHPPSTSPHCKKLQNTEFKKMEAEENFVHSSYLSQYCLFPFIQNLFSFQFLMFVILRKPIIKTTDKTKSRTNPFSLSFFCSTHYAHSWLSTLGGKPVEPGHAFFLRVGVWTGTGAQSTVWIRGQRRK